MKRRRLLTTAVPLAASLLAGCTGSGSGGSGGGGGSGNGASVEETSSVTMTNSQFQPRNVAVETGVTVTWANEDSTSHTVTSAADNWQKDTRVSGGSETTHIFEESGVYDVYCSIHGSADLSGMSMKVGVGDATIRSPLGGGSSGNGSSGNGSSGNGSSSNGGGGNDGGGGYGGDGGY